MMFLQALPLSGLLDRASSKLDMIADFGPFFMKGESYANTGDDTCHRFDK